MTCPTQRPHLASGRRLAVFPVALSSVFPSNPNPRPMATLAPSSESPELGEGKSSLSLFPTSPSVPLPGFPVLGPGKPLGYRKPQSPWVIGSPSVGTLSNTQHSGLWGQREGCLNGKHLRGNSCCEESLAAESKGQALSCVRGHSSEASAGTAPRGESRVPPPQQILLPYLFSFLFICAV